jgi:gamma-glutamyl:cysteine ligase YbdK (ATP-grasp superfamily)
VTAPLRLFEAFGVELEYMIVDADTLDVRPAADELLAAVGGGYEVEVELGPVAWSNELALHVVEIKTNGPVASLGGLGALFQEHVGRIGSLLAPLDARLLPGGMHPWMDPHAELRLWPHENNRIYATFDRIFGCRGHGWANLQSTHINLPFGDDEEVGRLHAASRLVLPILPGIAASSPFVDGAPSGLMDARLDAYRTNSARVPSVTGHVIPEPVFTRAAYEGRLLQGIYDDLAPLDPEGVLRHEWVNARGCIARFDRGAIEIRLLDIQECPRADIAVCAAVIAAVRALVEERWSDTARQRRWDERELEAVLLDAIRDGDHAVIESRPLLEAFGYPERGAARLGELWQYLVEELLAGDPSYPEWEEPLRVITREGCLARRLLGAAERAPPAAVYRRLAECLDRGEVFR